MAKITRTNPEGISKPFSNYSHVVTAEGAQKLVFCAGQVGADVDGKVLPPDDFDAQAKMVMANLTKALAVGGATIADVTKITIYICNPHPARRAEGPRHFADLFRRAATAQHAGHSARARQPQFPAGDRSDRGGVSPTPLPPLSGCPSCGAYRCRTRASSNPPVQFRPAHSTLLPHKFHRLVETGAQNMRVGNS